MHAPRGAPGEGGSRLCHRREGSRRHRTGARRSGVLPGTAPPFSAPGRDPRGTKLGVPRPSWGAEASRRRPAGPVWTCKCVVGRGGAFRGGRGTQGAQFALLQASGILQGGPRGGRRADSSAGDSEAKPPLERSPPEGPTPSPCREVSSQQGGQGRGEAGPVHLPGPDHPLGHCPATYTARHGHDNTYGCQGCSHRHPRPLAPPHRSPLQPPVSPHPPLLSQPAQAPGLWGPPLLHPWASPSRNPPAENKLLGQLPLAASAWGRSHLGSQSCTLTDP